MKEAIPLPSTVLSGGTAEDSRQVDVESLTREIFLLRQNLAATGEAKAAVHA